MLSPNLPLRLFLLSFFGTLCILSALKSAQSASTISTSSSEAHAKTSPSSTTEKLLFNFPSDGASPSARRRPLPIPTESLSMDRILSVASQVLIREQFTLPAHAILYIRDIHYSRKFHLTHVYLRPRTPSSVEITNFQLQLNFLHATLISFSITGPQGLMPFSVFKNTTYVDLSAPENNPTGFSWATTNAETLVEAPAMITPVEAVIALANYLHIPAPRAIDLTPSVSDQMTSAGTTTTITNVSYAADLTAKVTTSLYFDKSGSLTRTHRIQVRLDGNYLNAQISAEDGSILSLVDWVFSAGKFLVYGWGGPNDPSEGAPVLRGEDTRGITQFSPYGWVDPQSKRRWNVAGNNVDVRDGRKGALETDMGTLVPGYEDGVMAYQPGSLNQAASSIFFHGNMMHDFLGVYDFTVENGAFQKRNYGKGGREGGSIVILVNSDITERENPDIARFWAPPSPEPGIMELGVLQGRSAALTFDIPTHEYFHGVSSRSTGGATNADCLCGSRESEMLSEGWSDLMSVILRVTPKHTRRTAKFGFAEYVMGKNLRGRKYSAAPKDPKDPYSSIRGRTTHMGGAVWAGVLYDIFWNLVDRLGFDPDWMSGSTERGNTLTLWIIMVGMRLQPCLPTFLNARDAILQATEIIQPTVLCDVWRAFAARGLGVDSRLIQGNITATDAEVPLQPVDGFSLPAQCKDSKAAPIRQ